MTVEIPNFETLLDIAQKNPDQLEQLRLAITAHAINSAPVKFRHRLEGIQFQIDSTRRLAKNPLSACLRISNMMHQSLSELRSSINQTLESPCALLHQRQQSNAKIIPFAKY